MKDEKLYLEHIRDAIEKILRYSAGGRKAFMENTLIQDAVIRNFEIIGEAGKCISERTRNKHPEVPWSDIARFRDLLIHHYMGIDVKRVWNTIEVNLPAFLTAVTDILDDPE